MWGQSKLGHHDNIKEKPPSKGPIRKKAKQDLLKVKCFNFDNHKHLGKNCPKTPWVNDHISQGNKIFQRGFVVEIRAHKSKASNLLKLWCKVNNKFMCYLLDSGMTNSVMTLQVAEQMGVKTKLMVNSIIVNLAQGIVKPSFWIMLDVKLFCNGV